MRRDKHAICSSHKGFTLAETLITLVVIGIVAALTVPTLINNKRNEELRTGLFKAQATLSGALEMYYAKNGERLVPNRENQYVFKDKIMPYISTAKDCNKQNCSPNLNPVYKTFNGSQNLDNSLLDDGQFIMNDAMLVLIQNTDWMGLILISVDVNGYKKKPNKAGHDLFMFQLNSKGILVPMGAKGTYYYSATDNHCSESATSITNGLGCTAKALSDPNYFKNLH